MFVLRFAENQNVEVSQDNCHFGKFSVKIELYLLRKLVIVFIHSWLLWLEIAASASVWCAVVRIECTLCRQVTIHPRFCNVTPSKLHHFVLQMYTLNEGAFALVVWCTILKCELAMQTWNYIFNRSDCLLFLRKSTAIHQSETLSLDFSR